MLLLHGGSKKIRCFTRKFRETRADILLWNLLLFPADKYVLCFRFVSLSHKFRKTPFRCIPQISFFRKLSKSLFLFPFPAIANQPILDTIVGAVISSTILEPTVVNGSEIAPTEEILKFCGANDCPNNNISNPNLEEPDSTLVRNALFLNQKEQILSVLWVLRTVISVVFLHLVVKWQFVN